MTDALFEALPSAAQQAKNYAAWQKAFTQWLQQTQRYEMFRHRATKLTSAPDESERDFRARVDDARRETRDEEIDAIRKKFAAKRDSLTERLRRAESTVEREQQQVSQQKTQTMLSMGAAALGALFGRRAIGAGTLGRATTAARGVGRTMKEQQDVKRAAETVDAVRAQLEQLDTTILAATDKVAAEFDVPVEIERVAIAPKRGQVAVHFVALGWEPRS